MNHRLSKIIEELSEMKRDTSREDVTLSPLAQKWINDVSFLLDEMQNRDERIRKLERIIVNDRISKLE